MANGFGMNRNLSLTVHMYGCLFGTEVKHGVAVRYAYCTHVWLSIWFGGEAWCGS